MSTPLNEEALRAGLHASGYAYATGGDQVDVALAAITTYLEAAAQPVAQKLTDAEWKAFQAIPDQGYSHRAWVDARIAERVAAAQPEVNSDQKEQRLALGKLLEKAIRQCGIRLTYALSGPGELYDVAGILLREYPALTNAQPEFSVGGLTREAKAEVWDEGHKAGWEDRDEDVKIGWYGNYNADTKNPYES